MGMQLIFTDRESYRDKTSLFNQYFGKDETAFFIDEGGSSPEAVQGCAEMLDELTESFDHIFCAAGTATTAAGIYSGIKNKNWPTQLHVVPALKDGAFLQQEIEKYIETDDRLHFHADFHFGGYAKVNDELLKFIISYYHETGILLDPVYTGKLLFALHQLIETDTFSPGSRILWVHSGGLFGLLGMKEKFQQLDPDFTQNLAQLIPKQF
jgi:1-aminocyclopropane-1-carboxylate deaminase